MKSFSRGVLDWRAASSVRLLQVNVGRADDPSRRVLLQRRRFRRRGYSCALCSGNCLGDCSPFRVRTAARRRDDQDISRDGQVVNVSGRTGPTSRAPEKVFDFTGEATQRIVLGPSLVASLAPAHLTDTVNRNGELTSYEKRQHELTQSACQAAQVGKMMGGDSDCGSRIESPRRRSRG